MNPLNILFEYLGVAKTLYGDYFREIRKENSFIVALIKFVLVVSTLLFTLPVMLVIIHLINAGNKQIYDDMKKENKIYER